MTETTAEWTPLLTGDAATSALGAARRIAAALPRDGQGADPYLANGLLSSTVALSHLEQAGVLDEHDAWREPWLAAQQTTGRRPIWPRSLFYGPAGLLWVRAHLSSSPVRGERIHAGIAALTGAVARGDGGHGFDLLTGLVGVGVLGLELVPNEAGIALLQSVVAQLGRLAGDGAAASMRSPTTTRDPEGTLDIGVAHGLCGVIGLLAAVEDAGLGTAASRELLRRAVTTVMEHRVDGEYGPTLIAKRLPDDDEPFVPRPSWCYGAPGNTLTLLRAAAALDDRGLADDAVELGLVAARWATADPRPVSYICHGTAGVALGFHRLHVLTGVPAFADAASALYLETLARVERADDLRDLAYVRPAYYPDVPDCWAGILDGVAGIALALAAAAGRAAPSWDRMLLMSDRGR